MLKLGDKVKDRVSGFEGVAIARTVWLNGCVRWTIQPDGLDKDGKLREANTFDDHQLEVVIHSHVPPHASVADVATSTGGDRTPPVRHDPPRR